MYLFVFHLILLGTSEVSDSGYPGLIPVILVVVVVAILAVVFIVVYRVWKFKRSDSDKAQPTIKVRPDMLDFERDYEEPTQSALPSINVQANRANT